jgi:quinol monooxygenase YgiN
MSFVYSSVATRPNVGVQWFKDALPNDYNAIVTALRASPGYISGVWEQDPSNPNRFIINHTWDSKASWQAMSNALQATPAFQARSAYFAANGINLTIALSA